MNSQEQEALRLATLDGCDTDAERKAFASGRLQGLKEMDIAHCRAVGWNIEEYFDNKVCPDASDIETLRQEYQTN